MKNTVNFSISIQDQTDIMAAINTLQTKLNPSLVALTELERRQLLKMGDKSLAFVSKAHSYADLYKDQMPAFISFDDFNKDYELIQVISEYNKLLKAITTALDDTLMQAGSEAMESANLIYSAIKFAARNNVNGAREAYDDMRARYPGRGGSRSKSNGASGNNSNGVATS